MTAPAVTVLSLPSLDVLHAQFLEILPRIETHGQIVFRHLKCRHRKADAIQEMCALGWKWHLSLAQRGKDPREFVMTFVTFLAKAVKSGRKLSGQDKAKDVFSKLTQARHGFTVKHYPHSAKVPHEKLYSEPHGQREQDLLEEALQDNTITPIPDQVHYRTLLPCWLDSLGQRKKAIAEDLMIGERTQAVAARHKLTQGRISQIRLELKRNWAQFSGELASV